MSILTPESDLTDVNTAMQRSRRPVNLCVMLDTDTLMRNLIDAPNVTMRLLNYQN